MTVLKLNSKSPVLYKQSISKKRSIIFVNFIVAIQILCTHKVAVVYLLVN